MEINELVLAGSIANAEMMKQRDEARQERDAALARVAELEAERTQSAAAQKPSVVDD